MSEVTVLDLIIGADSVLVPAQREGGGVRDEGRRLGRDLPSAAG